MQSSDDIELRRVGDPEPEKNELPRGVKAMVLGNRIMFVRRVGGRLVPVSNSEQEQLKKKHVR